ncbi:MAG: hypothetical protein ACLQPD_14400 [Desulfomonilaceae bacterium]
MCYAVTRLTYDPEHGVEREEVVHVYTDQEIARTPAAYWNTHPDICPGPDTPGVRFSTISVPFRTWENELSKGLAPWLIKNPKWQDRRIIPMDI